MSEDYLLLKLGTQPSQKVSKECKVCKDSKDGEVCEDCTKCKLCKDGEDCCELLGIFPRQKSSQKNTSWWTDSSKSAPKPRLEIVSVRESSAVSRSKD